MNNCQTAVICLGTAKSHLCCLELLPPAHSQQGAAARVPRFTREVAEARAEAKTWTGRSVRGLCEVGVKQVGSSSAADWGLCRQEICWNLPLPASQGSCEGINQDFIQTSPDTSTMSQSSKNKNYSWGNKVKPETSSFSRFISDLIGKQFSIFFVGISMVWGANFTREKVLLYGK